MKKLYFLLIIAGFLLLPNSIIRAGDDSVYSSTTAVFLYPEKSSFLDPERLIIDLIIQPNGSLVNSALIELNYDPKMLMLTSVNRANSFCDYSPFEWTDTIKGSYNLYCGTPKATSTGVFLLARAEFKKIKAGFTTLKFSDMTRVLNHNGLGTSVILDREIHSIYLYK